MNQVSTRENSEQVRNLLFMSTPQLWPTWPFLAVMRRKPGCEEEFGVMYDLFHIHGRTGYSSTVFLTNLFLLPKQEEEFLALPRETFDRVEEIYLAGWRVD